MDTGSGHLSFGLFGSFISGSGMDSPPVMVALDIREQIASGILVRCPSPLVNKFDPERVEEAFHERIEAPIFVKRALGAFPAGTDVRRFPG